MTYATVYTEDILSGASGSFTADVTSLSPSTTYYYQAFMTVSDGNGGYTEITSTSTGSFVTSSHINSGTPQWMELPALSSMTEGTFYAHDLSGAEYINKTTSSHRNWSCYWSSTHKVSYWVAYPMFDEVNEKNVTRKDAFKYDPIVPQADQPNIGSNTYADSHSYSYSRGHQIPSSDRLSSTEVNKTTFYTTNMTPQIQSFNGGIWNNLETAVNSWAQASDTLYVVTGCIVDNNCWTTTDLSGNVTVTVPSHYYKALLRVKNGTYTGCAFYLDHFGTYSNGGTNYETGRKTIDQLETITGIDFFPNLISKVGSSQAATIESTSTSW